MEDDLSLITKQIVEQLDIIKVAEDLLGEPKHISRSKWGYVWKSFYVEEKTPSFKVSSSLKVFKCFSTGKYGNVIKLYQDFQNYKNGKSISYLQSCKELCSHYEIEIEINLSQKEYNADEKKLIQYLTEIMKYANRNLNMIGNNMALTYLEKRGFNLEICNMFNLGYLVNEKDYQQCFKNSSINSDDLMLIISNIKNVLIGNVLIPIKDKYGNIISIVGRTINPNAEIRYIKFSKDNIFIERFPHINPDQILYNYDLSNSYIKALEHMIIVESYFDVMQLYNKGIFNVVAIQTAHYNKEQLKNIKKVKTYEISVLLDGDTTGKQAQDQLLNDLSLLEEFNKVLIPRVSYIDIDSSYNDRDPDEYFKDKNEIEVKQIFDKRKDYRMYLIENEIEKYRNKENTIIDLKREIGLIINHYDNTYINQISNIIENNDDFKQDSELFKNLFLTNHQIQSLYLMNILLSEQNYTVKLLDNSYNFINRYNYYIYIMNKIQSVLIEFYSIENIKMYSSISNKRLYGEKSHKIVIEAFNEAKNKDVIIEIDYMKDSLIYYNRFSRIKDRTMKNDINFFESDLIENIYSNKDNIKIERIISDITQFFNLESEIENNGK